jgi:hypothetical protein
MTISGRFAARSGNGRRIDTNSTERFRMYLFMATSGNDVLLIVMSIQRNTIYSTSRICLMKYRFRGDETMSVALSPLTYLKDVLRKYSTLSQMAKLSGQDTIKHRAIEKLPLKDV